MVVNAQWYLEAKLNRMLREEWLAGDSWYLCLFTNDYTPAVGMVPGSFAEPDSAWYSRRFLDRDKWQEPTFADATATSLYGTAPLSWVVSGAAAELHGYYVLDTLGGRVVYAEQFAAPLSVGVGQELLIQPRYQETTLVVCV